MSLTTSFSESFDFETPATVNFVGGGGKTSLILRLLEEHASGTVLYTTTTRIHPPHPRDGLFVVTCDNERLLSSILECLARDFPERINRLVGTRSAMGPDLLRGVDPGFAETLDPSLFPLILNEADGSRRMSIKMPRPDEPVLMVGADYLVPVIGLDCVNRPLGPETVFRWEIASRRLGLHEGEPLSPGMAAEILLHPEGVCKGWIPAMKIAPFINKVDRDRDEKLALELAGALLRNKVYPIDRIVWGSLKRGTVAALHAGIQ